MSTNAFTDKIYNKLQDNLVKNKTLSGNLDPSEYENTEVFEFLRLLQKLGFTHAAEFKQICAKE